MVVTNYTFKAAGFISAFSYAALKPATSSTSSDGDDSNVRMQVWRPLKKDDEGKKKEPEETW